MKLTKNGIDIRNVVSLNLSGMYFDEFVEYHQMVVERKNAEIIALYDKIAALNDSKYTEITALNDSKFQCLNRLLAAMAEKRMETVHRMLKADISIEQIAELLGFSIENIRESAETEL
jgi:hypothetical protein